MKCAAVRDSSARNIALSVLNDHAICNDRVMNEVCGTFRHKTGATTSPPADIAGVNTVNNSVVLKTSSHKLVCD